MLRDRNLSRSRRGEGVPRPPTKLRCSGPGGKVEKGMFVRGLDCAELSLLKQREFAPRLVGCSFSRRSGRIKEVGWANETDRDWLWGIWPGIGTGHLEANAVLRNGRESLPASSHVWPFKQREIIKNPNDEPIVNLWIANLVSIICYQCDVTVEVSNEGL